MFLVSLQPTKNQLKKVIHWQKEISKLAQIGVFVLGRLNQNSLVFLIKWNVQVICSIFTFTLNSLQTLIYLYFHNGYKIFDSLELCTF